MKTSKQPVNDYFKQAKHWADDQFTRIEVSRNRYQVAFLTSMGLNLCAVLAVAVLAPMRTLVPMLVHHYDNGVTTIEPVTQTNATINQTQVESDIVRYITHRESYEVSAYRSQYDLVGLLSSESVNDEYLREQSKSNPQSPVILLGTKLTRSVHVYSINFLDNVLFNDKDFPKNHHNVAEVVFTLIDTDKATGQQTETQYNALISWVYNQPSNAPDIRWKNWDGFQVTRYSKQLRNV